jgi:PPOX class probable F420-dependent enzyme
MPGLSNHQIELLEEPHIAQFVTLMDDGSPQISPVWIDTDGINVLVNSALGRLKTNNIERDSRVAVGVYDPANAYSRVVNITGTVSRITQDGADEHINLLAKKYLNTEEYEGRNIQDTRVIIVIKPDRITGI